MGAIALFPDEGEVRIVEAPSVGSPRIGQVVVRTLRVGFCGTDRELITGRLGEAPPGSDYLILGHELVGEVVEVGSGVDGLTVGELVVAGVRRPCSACPACAVGRQDFCTSGGYTEHGIFRLHGFARPSVELAADGLVKVSAAMAESAFLAEPLSVVEKALEQAAYVRARLPWVNGVPERLNCLVAGAGCIGLLAASLLRMRGSSVTVFDRRPSDSRSARAARSVGAEYVQAEGAEVLDSALPKGAYELVIEATGNGSVALGMSHYLRSDGVLVLIGVPGSEQRVSLDVNGLLQRSVLGQHVVVPTINASRSHLQDAVADLERLVSESTFLDMVTDVHALEDFQLALNPAADSIKAAVEFAAVGVHT